MKHFSSLPILLLVSLIAFTAVPQSITHTVTREFNTVTVEAIAEFEDDSLATLFTHPFSFGGFQADTDSSAPYPFRYIHLFKSTAGLPRISVFLQGGPSASDTSNFVNIVTLDTGDSVETLSNSTIAITQALKYPYYRLKVVGYAGAYQPYNRSDATAKIWLYAYRKDN